MSSEKQSAPARQDAHAGHERGRAVVVGGARGIGFAIAEELVRTPWVSEVVIGDADEAQADLALTRLADQSTPCRAATIDVTDQQQIDAFASNCGEVEYLVVAAGIFDSGESLTFERSSFERVLSVNLTGAFYCAQRFGRDMVPRQSGSIVGVASIAARVPRFKQAAYAASKAGMRQAYRALGLEIASHGIRVNTVSPGPTDTEMMRRMATDHPSINDLAAGSPSAFRLPIPRGVVAKPREVAAAAVFLLSPAASHITLADLVVDGGELLGA
jgi:2,3-dihydro-2,3-dihydroxybenzoate dehydrogenase